MFTYILKLLLLVVGISCFPGNDSVSLNQNAPPNPLPQLFSFYDQFQNMYQNLVAYVLNLIPFNQENAGCNNTSNVTPETTGTIIADNSGTKTHNVGKLPHAEQNHKHFPKHKGHNRVKKKQQTGKNNL